MAAIFYWENCVKPGGAHRRFQMLLRYKAALLQLALTVRISMAGFAGCAGAASSL